MAQTRYVDFQQALTSYEQNLKLMGVIAPGRYRGFDKLNQNAGTLTFDLQHTNTGKTDYDIAFAPTGPKSVCISTQGTMIVEDADVPGGFGFSCVTNLPNAFIRYDAVYMAHEQIAIIGGQAATYGVVTGLVAETIPALPNPDRQILLGYIEIPANAVNLDDAVWHRSRQPSLGNGLPAFLNEPNSFTSFNAFPDAGSSASYDAPSQTITLGEGTTHVIALGANSDIKDLLDPSGLPLPDGTLLHLYIYSTLTYITLKGSGAAGKFAVTPISTGNYLTRQTGFGIYPSGWFTVIKRGGLWQILQVNETNFEQTKANKTQEAWTALTLVNNWIAEGSGTYFTPGYMKDEMGFVHLRGMLDRSTPATAITIATLPAGYRPSKTVMLHGLDVSLIAPHTASISSAGVLQLANSGGPLFSLDGLSFKAD